MKKPLALLVIALMSYAVSGQVKYDANWCFGDNAGISFINPNHPTTFRTVTESIEANASISDSAGQLLFYLSADKYSNINNTGSTYSIRDRNNIIIPNGDSILTLSTYTNGLIIIPSPENKKWLLFHIVPDSSYFPRPAYSEIIQDSNGLRVVNKNVLFFDHYVEERMTAVRHANGKDWWLLFHQSNYYDNFGNPTNRFYEYLITSDTITGPIINDIGFLHSAQGSFAGEMVFSPSGDELASVIYEDNVLELFDFDRCTGSLSNYKDVNNLSQGGNLYGCEFSSNGNMLYVTQIYYPSGLNSLYQVTMHAPDIAASKATIFSDTSNHNSIFQFGQLQIAPDGKIYMAAESNLYPYTDSDYTPQNNYLSVINQPDSSGITCNFQLSSFYLGDSSRTYLGLPNFPNYNLGPLPIYQADAGKDTVLCKSKNTGATIGSVALSGMVYQWQTSTTLSDTTIAQPLATPTADTFYVLTVTDTSYHGSSCNSRTDTVWVRVQVCDTMGVGGSPETESVRVYPNPASSTLTVETSSAANSVFLLCDFMGRSVLQQPVINGRNTIDVSNLSQGLYFYKVGDAVGKVQVLR